MVAARPFSQLSSRINKYKDAIDPATTRIIRKVASVGHESLVKNTQVDTGRARSNWVVTVDRLNTTVIPPYAPGERLGIGETANASAAIAQGNVAINSFKVGPNRSLFITNFVHYIGILDARPDGLSVDKSFQLMRSIAKGERLDLAKRVGR
jgi:hypothetical protein